MRLNGGPQTNTSLKTGAAALNASGKFNLTGETALNTDVFEMVKMANRIEDVIQDDVKLNGHGVYLRGASRGVGEHSLIVNTEKQYFYWNAHNAGGSVIDWVMWKKKMDLRGAVEWLAQRAGLELPAWNKEEYDRHKGEKKSHDIFLAAISVMNRWLLSNEKAVEYVKSRGWNKETVKGSEGRRGALLGFTGERGNSKELRISMRQVFQEMGADPDCPAAVSVLGFSGDVAGWAEKYQVQVPDNWIKRGYIVGLVGRDMLIYPHFRNGKVEYLSGRGIEDKDLYWNLPENLVGNKRIFLNEAWAPKSEKCVVVEGQACAVSLGQIGIPAVALAGVNIKDLPVVLEKHLSGHKYLYLGLDADEAGGKAGWDVAKILGPFTQMVDWRASGFKEWKSGDEVKPVKDMNDLLRSMVQANMDGDAQAEVVNFVLKESIPYYSVVVKWAGSVDGPERQEAIREAVEVISEIPPLKREMLRDEISKPMGLSWTQLKAVLAQVEKEGVSPSKKREPDEEVFIPGGYIDEHLIEMIYEPSEHTTAFVVRYPDGNVDVVDHIDLNDVRYYPLEPETRILKEQVILFPSKFPKPAPVLELVEVVQRFIHDFLDIDLYYEQLAAWYVLFTWLYDAFHQVPYLRALGDYGTGKTRFIETIGHLCYRPMIMAGATSTSAIFRLLDQYRGTLILDEADFGKSDETAEIIKIINVGNRSSGRVLRSMDNGNRGFDVVPFNVFGPKIIATRKKFGDQATESRCLTYETGSREVRADIPIVEPMSFYQRAKGIRNLCLAYRMAEWSPNKEVDYNAAAKGLEPRLNQVTMALKTLIRDEKVSEGLDTLMQEFNQRLVVERSQTMEAKILEAIIEITEKPILPGIEFDLSYKNIADVANEIIDAENDADEDGPGNNKLTNRGVGNYLRTKLGLTVERKNRGYVMVWDQRNRMRIEAMRKRYGV